MKMIDIRVLKSQHRLDEWVGRFTTLKGRPNQELKGGCPFCGGTDRFSVFKDRQGWMCRGCTPESGDLIAFVMRAYCTDFKGAIDIMSGTELNVSKDLQLEATRRNAAESALDWRSESWQLAAQRELDVCGTSLESGAEGMKYLESRGIGPESVTKWNLGYSHEKRAIVLPWIAHDGRITAVKYRYVSAWKDRAGKIRRFTQISGGRQILFGANLLESGKPTIIVEGEFNAISISQAITDKANVISAGGDSNFGPMVSLISKLNGCAVWLDSLTSVQAVIDRLPDGTCQPPFMVSTKHGDANEILVKYGSKILAEVIDGFTCRIR